MYGKYIQENKIKNIWEQKWSGLWRINLRNYIIMYSFKKKK